MSGTLLTINTGSSSLKAALFQLATSEQRVFTAQVERVGLPGSHLRVADAGGVVVFDQKENLSGHGAAMPAFLSWLRSQGLDRDLAGIGHRVVHGGSYREPRRIDDAMIRALEELVPIDPDHLPQALAAINAAGRTYPAIPQVACFDTGFHRAMPRVAQLYPLPRALADAGVVRYGFHGLSYEYILEKLRRVDPVAARGRVIVAHLGNGASMAAVRDGVSIDTTMGFTPTGGLMMGTRSGDLDPGVLLYLLQERGLSANGLNDLVNRQAGLLGVSGTSADMRDLLGRMLTDPAAAEAVELFCYLAKKHLGALAAALGGLDTLVFTAGIGEHGATVRQRICDGLQFLGIDLDPDRNTANAPIVSRDGGSVVVRVMETDEERMIARHTERVIFRGGSHDVSV